jgi:hypothetical protein
LRYRSFCLVTVLQYYHLTRVYLMKNDPPPPPRVSGNHFGGNMKVRKERRVVKKRK